ncbi:MAG: retron system putative HNH endonuclease [Pseudomonadota bacterium]
MQKIVKGNEPKKLSDWKRLHPKGKYQDLSKIERQAIREKCLNEQYYLCAYCCQHIDDKKSHNEHIQAQHVAPNQTLNFHNIVASCNEYKQCGNAHGAKRISLTPLMSECETELEFNLSGHVKGLTPRATDTIDILNLDNKELIHTRKQLVKRLIFMHGERPEELQLLDDDLLQILMEEINLPQDGQLSDFAPILQNILRQLLKTR